MTRSREVSRSEEQPEPALLGAGECGQVVGQPPQPAHLLTHDTETFRAHRQDAVDHALDGPLDDGERGAHLVRDLAQETDPAGLGLGQRAAQRVHVVGEERELVLAGPGHVHVVPSRCYLARGVAELPQGAHEALRREDAERGRRDDADDDADHQRLGDRLGHLAPQRASAAPPHHRPLAGHHLVEQRRGEGPDHEEGGQTAQDGHQHVRQDEPDRETVHGATPIGERRNL